VWLIVAGVVIGGFGGLIVAEADGSAEWSWLLVGVGGLLAQIGVIAAGVEWGMRRVRGY